MKLSSDFLQSQSQDMVQPLASEDNNPGTSGLVQRHSQQKKHYSGKLSERNLKKVSEETTDKGFNLDEEATETVYALHCAKFIREYCRKKQPDNSQRRKQLKENIEKISEQDCILNL